MIATILPRRCGALLLGLAFLAFAAPPASAKQFTLPELLDLARANPGLQASSAATAAMQAQVLEAKLNWLPQGDLLSVLAPSPTVECCTARPDTRRDRA